MDIKRDIEGGVENVLESRRVSMSEGAKGVTIHGGSMVQRLCQWEHHFQWKILKCPK